VCILGVKGSRKRIGKEEKLSLIIKKDTKKAREFDGSDLGGGKFGSSKSQSLVGGQKGSVFGECTAQ